MNLRMLMAAPIMAMGMALLVFLACPRSLYDDFHCRILAGQIFMFAQLCMALHALFMPPGPPKRGYRRVRA